MAGKAAQKAPERVRLTRDRIVAAALTQADRAGFSSVTMRSVAAELGVKPMALYHHIESKSRMVEEMVEALIAETSLDQPTASWRDWVTLAFNELRRVAVDHPGAVEALAAAPATGPTARQASLLGLERFLADGFSPSAARQAIQSVSVTALGHAIELTRPPARADLDDALEWLRDSHPSMAAVTLEEIEAEDPWDFTIAIMIAGLESLAQQSSATKTKSKTTNNITKINRKTHTV